MPDNIRHNSTLSPVQQQVALALASGKSVTAAAAEAGIHRSTVHNWNKIDSAFRAEFDRIRHERMNDLYDQLFDLDTIALDTIRHLVEDPKTPAAVRLRASLAILQRTIDPAKVWTVHQLPLPQPESDQPEILSEDPSLVTPARNAPCPCGSNQKYKRCCGKSAPPLLGSAARARAA